MYDMKNFKKAFPYLVLIILALVVLFVKSNKTANTNKTDINTNNPTINEKGLNRSPSIINYTKHARCRMKCREITENEIIDILKNGKINYRKSDLKLSECKKKYAIEGFSKSDNQHIRIVVAPCEGELSIITCIDLKNEYQCNCN